MAARWKIHLLRSRSKCFESEHRRRVSSMTFAAPYGDLSLDETQLRAYFGLMDVAGLLRHKVEQQLRAAANLTYVQFKVLARLGLDSETGSLRMTELAD